MPQFYPEATTAVPAISDFKIDSKIGGLNSVTSSPQSATGCLFVFITGADGPTEGTGTTWTAPSGATQLSGYPLTASGWAPAINVWTKVPTAADYGTIFNFGLTNSGAQTSFLVVLCPTTTATAGPRAFNGTALSGNPGTINQTSSTMPAGSVSIVFGFAQNFQQILPLPTGYTQLGNTMPTYRGGIIGNANYPIAGSTGVRAWNMGTIGNNAYSVGEVVVS